MTNSNLNNEESSMLGLYQQALGILINEAIFSAIGLIDKKSGEVLASFSSTISLALLSAHPHAQG